MFTYELRVCSCYNAMTIKIIRGDNFCISIHCMRVNYKGVLCLYKK